ncbi:MAG TPA: Mur ligase family protein [Bacteroidales bacterium]|nr:Mur ligase family protein [Bacteroidales bacterium]
MRIHFIAIGGSAMHNLALALADKGYTITGSDDEIFEPSRSRLANKGLLPEKEGWFPEKLDNNIDAVILGMHAKADNPELLRAKELKLKIYSYPEYLYEQSKDKTRIVIGGSHGKTTITAMVLHAFKQAGIISDYMIGAHLEGFEVMVKLSHNAHYMVIEGDEYLTSPIDPRPKFHLYHPHIALLSGIAWDHFNVFPSFEIYKKQFEIFASSIVPHGTLVYCNEDETVRQIARNAPENITKVGYSMPESFLKDHKTYVKAADEWFSLQIFGKHNLLNLMGAMEVCKLVGIDNLTFMQTMTSFRGASNRLELIAQNESTTIYRDFAHSPSKVKATVEALYSQYQDRNLVACLELHTYSSLNKDFLPQYKGSLKMAQKRVVYFNPHALQLKNLPFLLPEEIKSSFEDDSLQVFDDINELLAYLESLSWKNTNLLLMSSGNFDGLDLKRLADKILLTSAS